MPISLKNLFSFRKAANLSNIDTLTGKTWIEKIKAKEPKWAKAQTSKKRNSSSQASKNPRSIFSRIASIFKKNPKVIAPPMESLSMESPDGQKTTREFNLSKMKQNLSTTLIKLKKPPVGDYLTGVERQQISVEIKEGKLCKNKSQVSWLKALMTTRAKHTISRQIRRDLPSLESNLEINDNDPQTFDFNVIKTKDETVHIDFTQNLYKARTRIRLAEIKIKIDIPPEENSKPIISQFEISSFPQPIPSSSRSRLERHPTNQHRPI